MKKLVFVAIATFGLILSANAQYAKFGAKGGLNLANVSGDDAEDTNMRTTFHVGGVFEFMLSDKFSFQPELLYSAQGYTFEEEELEGTTKIDYLNLPLIGKFYVADGFSIQVGPQIGFLLSAKSEGEILGVEFDEDIKDELKEIDFGAALGIGYKLPSGLFFDARYNLGLTDIPDEDDVNVKNGVIQVSLGFMF